MLITCLLIQAEPSFANDKELLEKLSAKYKSMQNFTADFKQKLYHNESQHTQERSGIFYFQKELYIRWETTKPDQEILIVNPNAVWNYIPDEEIAYKYSADVAKEGQNILSILTGKTALDNDFEVEIAANKKIEGKNFHVLKLYPLEPSLDLVEAEIWIEPSSMLITKAIIFDFYANKNEVIFENYKVDSSLDIKLFDFTPPKDIDVEDHSQMQNFQIKGL